MAIERILNLTGGKPTLPLLAKCHIKLCRLTQDEFAAFKSGRCRGVLSGVLYALAIRVVAVVALAFQLLVWLPLEAIDFTARSLLSIVCPSQFFLVWRVNTLSVVTLIGGMISNVSGAVLPELFYGCQWHRPLIFMPHMLLRIETRRSFAIREIEQILREKSQWLRSPQCDHRALARYVRCAWKAECRNNISIHTDRSHRMNSLFSQAVQKATQKFFSIDIEKRYPVQRSDELRREIENKLKEKDKVLLNARLRAYDIVDAAQEGDDIIEHGTLYTREEIVDAHRKNIDPLSFIEITLCKRILVLEEANESLQQALTTAFKSVDEALLKMVPEITIRCKEQRMLDVSTYLVKEYPLFRAAINFQSLKNTSSKPKPTIDLSDYTEDTCRQWLHCLQVPSRINTINTVEELQDLERLVKEMSLGLTTQSQSLILPNITNRLNVLVARDKAKVFNFRQPVMTPSRGLFYGFQPRGNNGY